MLNFWIVTAGCMSAIITGTYPRFLKMFGYWLNFLSYRVFTVFWSMFFFTFSYGTFQQVCVQCEQSVRVSFFTWSRHCDNEFIWRHTLRAVCVCRRVHSLHIHAHLQFICVNLTIAHYIVCVCVWMCQIAAGDQLAAASVRRWAYTHLCVALLHQLITHSHTNTQTALLHS